MTRRRQIDLTLTLGSCLLSFDAGRRTAGFGASNITDAVAEAVHACVELTRGRRDVSFIWRAEPEGVFVDIHAGHRLTNLVVHDMRNPDWSFDNWLPERGDVLFRLSAKHDRFLLEFAESVVSLPAQAATGRPLWGLPLPEHEIAEVGRWLEQQTGVGSGGSVAEESS
ncbi:MAG: hypothetical protein ACT4RN_08815 [Pseudonocardia sp.]